MGDGEQTPGTAGQPISTPATEGAAGQSKPGFKTTEFWICAVLTLAGMLPTAGIFPDTHVAVKVAGLIVSLGAALGYTVVRGSVKKAPYSGLFMVLVIPLALMLAGCKATQAGYIRADAVDGLIRIVCERHDQLLKGELDPKTFPADKRATYLRSTEQLIKLVDEAKPKP